MNIQTALPSFDELLFAAGKGNADIAATEKLRPFYEKICNDKILADLMLESLNGILTAKLPENCGKIFFKQDELETFYFLLVLAAYRGGKANFARTPYPPEMFDEIWLDLKNWADYYLRETGSLRFSEGVMHWYQQHLTGKLVSMGRLQFELPLFHNGAYPAEPYLQPGDAKINMHIPACGKLDIDECVKSLRRIYDFSRQYLPEYDFKAVCCYSWLWDNALEKFLPADGNVMRLKKLGITVQSDNPSDALWRLFGETPPNEYPDPNRLQRSVLQYADNHGKLRYAALIFPFDKLAVI